MQESRQALHEHQDGQCEERPHGEDEVQLDGVHAGTAHAHDEDSLPEYRW